MHSKSDYITPNSTTSTLSNNSSRNYHCNGSAPTTSAMINNNLPSNAIDFPHFHKGSVIELGNKNLKRIEDIKPEDLMQSSGSNNLCFAKVTNLSSSSSSTSSSIQKSLIEVTLQCNGGTMSTWASIEQPFISREKGWVSASPALTSQLYGLQCEQIGVGCELLIGYTSMSENNNAAAAAGDVTNPDSLMKGKSSMIGNSFESSSAVSAGGGPRSAFTPIPMSPSRHGTRKRAHEIDSSFSTNCKTPVLQNQFD